ncbi:MAG: glycosyltransferase family 4 protein [Pirellulales bacterium]|nr:glycosyltransferase family 4 protein [Pirellulales bacterium]
MVAPHDEEEIVDRVKIQPVEVPANRSKRIKNTLRQVFQTALAEDADVYHFHDPELITVGWMLKRRGKRVIYDVHEDVPRQIMSKPWIPGVLRGIVGKATERLEAWSAGWLDGIVAATPVIASRFPEQKTITVNNFPVLNSEFRASELQRQEADPKLITYVGGISRNRGAADLLAALSLLGDRPDLRLVFAGKFMPPELEQELKGHDAWSRVDFLGWCNREAIASLLRRSSVGVVPLYPLQRFMDSQPVKMYEYMAAGIPVIASDFPRWREVVQSSGCGLLVEPKNPHSLAKAIAWLVDHPDQSRAMGQRGRAAVQQRYNWKAEEAVLLNFYDRLFSENHHHHRGQTPIHQSGARQQKARRAA